MSDDGINPPTHFLQPKITGYRQLSQTDADVINTIKAMGNEVGTVVQAMLSSKKYDERWINIAKTDLQKGFMALVRAVAKPESF